ncbi:hypothetical protein XCR1_1540012 [Xenorhabdus cabanillasii JM26]|uniref:Uncharacterized protein n=1 Tax=Xenorhabdus cabanillasii JM26 TaxID=1427517 RepID=W1IPQ1_9GAMM|nr:hypothetical protein XCR1_1540012 [Xenorhabdus cabanillasii JM26]
MSQKKLELNEYDYTKYYLLLDLTKVVQVITTDTIDNIKILNVKILLRNFSWSLG